MVRDSVKEWERRLGQALDKQPRPKQFVIDRDDLQQLLEVLQELINGEIILSDEIGRV